MIALSARHGVRYVVQETVHEAIGLPVAYENRRYRVYSVPVLEGLALRDQTCPSQVIGGNVFDKYHSSNPVARLLVRNFLRTMTRMLAPLEAHSRYRLWRRLCAECAASN